LAATGSENVTEAVADVGTPDARPAGSTETTVGAVVSVGGAAAVVNVEVVAEASGLPARSRTAVDARTR
jgi:hypothetical protein